MQDIRRVLCWSFAFTCLLHIFVSARDALYASQQHDELSFLGGLMFAALFSILVATVSGVAWWTMWKSKSSARGWAIIATLASVLIFLRAVVFHLHIAWHHLGALVIGIIGLVAFSWHYEPPFSDHANGQSADGWSNS